MVDAIVASIVFETEINRKIEHERIHNKHAMVEPE